MPSRMQPTTAYRAVPIPNSSPEDVVLDSELSSGAPTSGIQHVRSGHSHSTRELSQPASTLNWNAEGIDALSQKVKQLVNAITRLSEIGIESMDMPLPKIVVVGDQSAGKSSVIEAISQISVPRAADTCTRCPIHINLTSEESSSSWQCIVYLHKIYDYYPDLSSPVENSPFGPWRKKREPSDTLFAEVRDPKQLEHILKRAQLATLNPGQAPTSFASSSANVADELQTYFSPNVVRLDIKGPNLPNLSFYDLPGIVNQLPDGTESHERKLVKNLVKDYVQREEVIVLLACSLENDLHNSSAAHLVRKCGAVRRCLGVLTKPDRLAAGQKDQSLAGVLSGDQFELGHGYFVTKQPSQLQIDKGMTHSQARAEEERFFKSRGPWNGLCEQYHERFGTPNLQKELSKLLTYSIQDSLPGLTEQVQEKLADITFELSNMPETSDSKAQMTVIELLTAFKDTLKHTIKGEHPHHELKQAKNNLFEGFIQSLYKMRPSLRCQSAEEEMTARSFNSTVSSQSSAEAIAIDSDDEHDVTPSANSRKRLATAAPRTPAKRARLNAATPSAGSRSEYAKKYDLDSIRDIIRDVSTSQLPGLVNPKAAEIMIQQSFENLQNPVDTFWETLTKTVAGRLKELLQVRLAKWDKTEIFYRAPQLLEAYVSTIFTKVKTSIDRLVRLECHKPITLNKSVQEYYRQIDMANYQTARRKARGKIYLSKQENKSGKKLEDQARAAKLDQLTEEELGKDPFHDEVEVMSYVASYYTIATSRLVDNISQIVEMEVFDECTNALWEHLIEELGAVGPAAHQRCIELLAEDPQRRAHRQRLCREQQRLKHAAEELRRLPQECCI